MAPMFQAPIGSHVPKQDSPPAVHHHPSVEGINENHGDMNHHVQLLSDERMVAAAATAAAARVAFARAHFAAAAAAAAAAAGPSASQSQANVPAGAHGPHANAMPIPAPIMALARKIQQTMPQAAALLAANPMAAAAFLNYHQQRTIAAVLAGKAVAMAAAARAAMHGGENSPLPPSADMAPPPPRPPSTTPTISTADQPDVDLKLAPQSFSDNELERFALLALATPKAASTVTAQQTATAACSSPARPSPSMVLTRATPVFELPSPSCESTSPRAQNETCDDKHVEEAAAVDVTSAQPCSGSEDVQSEHEKPAEGMSMDEMPSAEGVQMDTADAPSPRSRLTSPAASACGASSRGVKNTTLTLEHLAATAASMARAAGAPAGISDVVSQQQQDEVAAAAGNLHGHINSHHHYQHAQHFFQQAPVAAYGALGGYMLMQQPVYTYPAAYTMAEEVVDDASSMAAKRKERWTAEEHILFLEGLERYGRRWTKIQTLLPHKTAAQIRVHAYSYFSKAAGVESPTSPTNVVCNRQSPRNLRSPLAAAAAHVPFKPSSARGGGATPRSRSNKPPTPRLSSVVPRVTRAVSEDGADLLEVAHIISAMRSGDSPRGQRECPHKRRLESDVEADVMSYKRGATPTTMEMVRHETQ